MNKTNIEDEKKSEIKRELESAKDRIKQKYPDEWVDQVFAEAGSYNGFAQDRTGLEVKR